MGESRIVFVPLVSRLFFLGEVENAKAALPSGLTDVWIARRASNSTGLGDTLQAAESLWTWLFKELQTFFKEPSDFKLARWQWARRSFPTSWRTSARKTTGSWRGEVNGGREDCGTRRPTHAAWKPGRGQLEGGRPKESHARGGDRPHAEHPGGTKGQII